MSHKANVSIEQVVSSGPGLAFIVYPKAISLMPLPHFWAITFFLMIFLLGIDSQFVTCESGMMNEFIMNYLILKIIFL
jgi:solute carrier family 6 amino acid transporter-like protein 5/7/9/14